MLFETVREIADQIESFRDELGITYWVAPESRASGFEDVVQLLAD